MEGTSNGDLGAPAAAVTPPAETEKLNADINAAE